MPGNVQRAAPVPAQHPAFAVAEQRAGNDREAGTPDERIDYVENEDDKNDYASASNFRKSDRGRRFEEQYRNELTRFSSFMTSELLGSEKAGELQGRVESFKEHLFDSTDYFSSKSWMMFSFARNEIEKITDLLSSSDISDNEKITALDGAAGSIDACADGVLSNLENARKRLECVKEGGEAIFESVSMQKIEAEAQLFAQHNKGHTDHFEGNEIHIVNAFKDYAINEMFKGLKPRLSGDALAEHYTRNTEVHHLEEFIDRLSMSITPGSVVRESAAELAAKYHQLLEGIHSRKISGDTRELTMENIDSSFSENMYKDVIDPLNSLMASGDVEEFGPLDLMDVEDGEELSYNPKAVVSFKESEQKIKRRLTDAFENLVGPFVKSTWSDMDELTGQVSRLDAGASSLHQKNGVKFWVETRDANGVETRRAPRMTDLLQMELGTFRSSLVIDLTCKALEKVTMIDDLMKFLSAMQTRRTSQRPEGLSDQLGQALKVKITQAVQEKTSTDSRLRTDLTLKIQTSETVGDLASVQPLVGVNSELRAACIDRTYQLVPLDSQMFADTLKHLADLDVVSRLSKESVGVLAKKRLLGRPTTKAANLGHMGAMKNILTAGNFEIKENTLLDDNRLVLSMHACKKGNFEMVKLLIGEGEEVVDDIHKQDGQMRGTTLLHLASLFGNPKVVELLLGKGGNVDVLNNLDATPLRGAVRGGYFEVVKLLLDNKADIEKGDIEKGDIENSTALNGYPLLLIACLGNYSEVVELLLDKGAEVDRAAPIGATPLNTACQRGYAKVVKLLLDKGANVDRETPNGATPLHAACEMGYTEVVKLLLDKGANVNKSTSNGFTPLQLACRNGQSEVVKLLLDREVSADQPAPNGIAPLQLACQNGHSEVVKLLLDKEADVNKPAPKGSTALNLACQGGHSEVVELLLGKGVDVNKPAPNGSTALNLACQGGHFEVVKLLLDGGASADRPTPNNVAPLYVACQNGHSEVVKLLLDKKVDVDKLARNDSTALHAACQGGHSEVVKLLLDKEADVNKPGQDGTTPLYLACQSGHSEVVKLLLDKKVDEIDIERQVSDGSTALHVACLTGHSEVVELLLDKVVDVNRPGPSGLTPLAMACNENHSEVVRLLLDKKADVDPQAAWRGFTPLTIACLQGHAETVELLLDEKADIDRATGNGSTPLLLACRNNHFAVVKLLLGRGADANKPRPDGSTPLSIARSLGNFEVAELLTAALHAAERRHGS